VTNYAANFTAFASGGYVGTPPDIYTVSSNVALVNAALNSIKSSSYLTSAETAYRTSYLHLAQEVALLSKAGATFGSAPSSTLKALGTAIGSIASDSTQLMTRDLFANLITGDVYGDTIKSVIAEYQNQQTLSARGINLGNDPRPAQAISQAASQNISITTYLSQNK
jgi:hypothetical protein